LRGKLLFIDDDAVFCDLLVKHFEDDYDVTGFTDPREAAGYLRENEPDVIVTDLSMPGMDGLDLLRTVKAWSMKADVIIMTAYGRVDTAVEAMKKGAYDYILKPFTTDELSLQLKNLFEKRRLSEENIHLRKLVGITYMPESIIGESREMKEVYRLISQVSQMDVSILIIGESGTGKELVARAIHFSGKRKNGKIVSVDCGTQPPELLDRQLFGYEKDAFPGAGGRKTGLFEEAEGGTLVLDEIGDLDMSLQLKIAEALEKRTISRIGGSHTVPFDVIVVATTNRDLEEMRRRGEFHGDLFRLNIFSLKVPSLRERKEDIPLLAEHFLSLYRNEFEKPGLQLSPESLNALKNYDWPGNVRELKGLFARICLLEDTGIITPEHIMKRLGAYIPTTEESERENIREALGNAKGNMRSAAKTLNMSYETLRYRMKKFGIQLPRKGSGEVWQNTKQKE